MVKIRNTRFFKIFKCRQTGSKFEVLLSELKSEGWLKTRDSIKEAKQKEASAKKLKKLEKIWNFEMLERLEKLIILKKLENLN